MVLKRKHTVSRILAAALAVAMLGCWPVTAFAEETDPTPAETTTQSTTEPAAESTDESTGDPAVESSDVTTVLSTDSADLLGWKKNDYKYSNNVVTLNKTLTLRPNTLVPDTSIVFDLKTGVAESKEGKIIQGGVDGGLTMDNGGVLAFKSTDTPTIAWDGKSASITKQFKMTVHPEKFLNPGVYHYRLSETDSQYEGMTYDTALRDVYVCIIYKNGYTHCVDASTLVCSAVVIAKGTKKDSIGFVNDYSGTRNLIVTKEVTGQQGNKNEDFDFTVSITDTLGKKYSLMKNGKSQTITANTEGGTVSLKSGESFTIYGLSATDTCTVTEVKANQNGYKTTCTVVYPKDSAITVDGGEAKGVLAADTKLLYTNDRTVTVPTGLVTDVLPYAGMVLLAIACGIYLLRRKHEDEL